MYKIKEQCQGENGLEIE